MIGSEPTFSVSDFVAIFNQSVEVMYPSVVVTGELANFRISKNMWVYCDLKDEFASVKFFGTVRSLPGPLEDGMMLEIIGKPYLHPKFGFSIQIAAVQAVGEGSIKKAQNLLAEKLEREGLFAAERKRLLPFPPDKIGLIASVESAAYSDFMKIIAARWPALQIESFDVQVQGVDAPAQIVSAFEAANQKADLEALILIRGGGSKDDMQAFDHELVVRAVAASRIPTMVAIGHERDVALAELAADQRASTPSNAAELLVPNYVNERRQLAFIKQNLVDTLAVIVQEARHGLQQTRLEIDRTLERRMTEARSQLDLQKRLIEVLDPRQPLQRGFALVRNDAGKTIRSAQAARSHASLTLEFADGQLAVEQNGLK